MNLTETGRQPAECWQKLSSQFSGPSAAVILDRGNNSNMSEPVCALKRLLHRPGLKGFHLVGSIRTGVTRLVLFLWALLVLLLHLVLMLWTFRRSCAFHHVQKWRYWEFCRIEEAETGKAVRRLERPWRSQERSESLFLWWLLDGTRYLVVVGRLGVRAAALLQLLLPLSQRSVQITEITWKPLQRSTDQRGWAEAGRCDDVRSRSPTYQSEVRWPLTPEAAVSRGGNGAAARTLLVEHILTTHNQRFKGHVTTTWNLGRMKLKRRLNASTRVLSYVQPFTSAPGTSVLPPGEDRWTSGSCRCCLGTGRTRRRTAGERQRSLSAFPDSCSLTSADLPTLSFAVAITRAFGTRMAVLVFLMYVTDITGMAICHKTTSSADQGRFDVSRQVRSEAGGSGHLGVFAKHFGVEADPVVGDEHASLVEDVLLQSAGVTWRTGLGVSCFRWNNQTIALLNPFLVTCSV